LHIKFKANATSGTFAVTAAVSGVSTPALFALTNQPSSSGVLATITIVGPSSQSTPVGTAFAQPLQVRVADAAGHPVAGVTVTFTAPAADPGGAFSGQAQATAITDANGIASAPTLTAGTRAGTFTVTAAVNGIIEPAVFHLTAVSVHRPLHRSPRGSRRLGASQVSSFVDDAHAAASQLLQYVVAGDRREG
jgi:hypothetical protein